MEEKSQILINIIEDIVRKIITQELLAKDLMKKSKPEKKYLSVTEAAEYLSLKKSTIYCYCSRKEIPFTKKNNRTFILTSDLDEWIQSGEYHKSISQINERISEESDSYLLNNEINL